VPTPRFSSREEYLAWKNGQQSAPSAQAPHASAPAAEPPRKAGDKPKQGLKETFSGLPGWSWLFILGCLAVPVVSLGGAIPGALGFGGAAGCATLAKKPGWEPLLRVVACTGITVGVWVLFIGFAVALATARK